MSEPTATTLAARRMVWVAEEYAEFWAGDYWEGEGAPSLDRAHEAALVARGLAKELRARVDAWRRVTDGATFLGSEEALLQARAHLKEVGE